MAKKDGSAPGPLLRFVAQRHSSDCTIACLAMFLGVRYEDVLLAFGKPIIDVGASVKDIKLAAAQLRMPLKLRRGFSLDTDTGILGVRFTDRKQEHVVVLHEGLIFDTDGLVWEADDYMTVEHAKPTSLLVRDDKRG